MAGADPLFSVRNNFYLGAYQTAISDASTLTGLSEAQKLERDVFVYRSYVELGSYEMVLSEIPPAAHPSLAAVRLLASYMKAGPAGSQEVVATLAEGLEDASLASNPTFLHTAALVQFLQGDATGSLRLSGPAQDLELLALSVQALLALHRPDAAEKQVRAMSALDDDAALTHLAGAWVALAAGGGRVREAAHAFQELGERFVWTPRLHTSLAAAQMRMGSWEDAEAELLQAVEKNPKESDALANLAVVSLHLGKPAGRYLGVLKDVAPGHALLEARAAADEAFTRATTGSTA